MSRIRTAGLGWLRAGARIWNSALGPAPTPPGEPQHGPTDGAPWWRPPLVDVIIAGVLSLLVVYPPLFITLPLAWRRRLPLAAFLAQTAGLALSGGDLSPELVAFVTLLFGAYSFAAYYPSGWTSLSVLLGVGTWVALQFGEVTPDMPDWLTPFALLIPMWLAGNQIRQSRRRAQASTSRAERLERERDTAAQEAIAHERARIARELHDVVTHNVSVMVIQATAAAQVLEAEPELALGAIRAVERVGQEAMAELREMLNVIGADEPTAPSRPQSGLDQLDALLARVRDAGLPVSSTQSGVRRPPPSGIDLAAYRVIQEALTNVLRHAPGARTRVHLDYGGEALEVSVSNDPAPGATAPSTEEGGRGLAGLAERVRFHHGELWAGPRPEGGYQVRARIPWEVAP